MTLLLEDSLITGLYVVRNPDKLARVECEVPVTR